jgi:hypothetical protein
VQLGSNYFKTAEQIIANGVPYEETPQGEWIISQTMDCHSDIINVYTCPFCGKKSIVHILFVIVEQI